MSFVKMTDILVSTSAFIVTLTHTSNEATLEVTPIVHAATQDVGLAEKFFHVITADSTSHNKRSKEETLEAFNTGCSRKIIEQFWDTSQWNELQRLCLKVPSIICILYDKRGNLTEMHSCKVLDILWALQRVEHAFFSDTWAPKNKEAAHAHKKDLRSKQNRATHKYFLHHRAA